MFLSTNIMKIRKCLRSNKLKPRKLSTPSLIELDKHLINMKTLWCKGSTIHIIPPIAHHLTTIPKKQTWWKRLSKNNKCHWKISLPLCLPKSKLNWQGHSINKRKSNNVHWKMLFSKDFKTSLVECNKYFNRTKVGSRQPWRLEWEAWRHSIRNQMNSIRVLLRSKHTHSPRLTPISKTTRRRSWNN